jgi:hypothetical protein
MKLGVVWDLQTNKNNNKRQKALENMLLFETLISDKYVRGVVDTVSDSVVELGVNPLRNLSP